MPERDRREVAAERRRGRRTRRGARQGRAALTITWKAAKGAARYGVRVALPDGRKLFFLRDADERVVRITDAPAAGRVIVRVVGLRADNGAGPAATANSSLSGGTQLMQGRIRRLIAATAAAMALIGTGTALADGTVVSGGPSGTTTDATPTFTFSGEPGATFECKIQPAGQAAAFKPCTSPNTAQLTDGDYTFSVRATDAAGNVETNPPSRAFTVDTAAIDTAIDAGPEGLTNDPTPSFTFSTAASGATFECRIEGASSLRADLHRLLVAVQGAEARLGRLHAQGPRQEHRPARSTRRPPSARSRSTPTRRRPRSPTAPDERRQDDRAPPDDQSRPRQRGRLELRVPPRQRHQGGASTPSPGAAARRSNKLAELEGGQHTIEVRATDAAGNTDATPAKRTFTVLVCDTRGALRRDRGARQVPGQRRHERGARSGSRRSRSRSTASSCRSLGGYEDRPRRADARAQGRLARGREHQARDRRHQALRGRPRPWDLPEGGAGEEKEFKKIDLSGAGQKLFGMKVDGYAALRLRRPANEGGAYKTVFALHVALPEVFKSGPSAGAGGVTGDVSINIDAEGVHLDGLKIQVTNAYIGKLGVKCVCLSFAAAGSSRRRAVHGALDRRRQAEAVHRVPLGQPGGPLGRGDRDRPADRGQDRARPLGRPARRPAEPRGRLRRQPRHRGAARAGHLPAERAARRLPRAAAVPGQGRGGDLARPVGQRRRRSSASTVTCTTPTPTAARRGSSAPTAACGCSTSRSRPRTSSTGARA